MSLTREDLQANYSVDEITRIFDDLVLGSLSADHFESLFHAGHLECSIFGFENAAMFNFLIDDSAGVFITMDRDVDLNLDEFIHTCKHHLNHPA